MSKEKLKTPVSPRQDEQGVNLQFKLLSAIGIFMIVSGHCYNEALPLLYNWFPVYTFNISLFVFISGYFYKPSHEQHAFRYIIKRFKRLVVPAYLWNMIYGLLVSVLRQDSFLCFDKITPYDFFIMPLVDGEAFKINLGSWFAYPLFFVCVINVLLRRLLKLIKADNEIFLTALYLCGGMAAVYMAINHQEINHGVMKTVLRVLFMLPLYQFGRLYHAKLERRDTLNSTAYFGVIFAVQLLILTFFDDLEYTPSAMQNFHNGFVLPYVLSVTGIAFWLRVTRILAPAIANCRLVTLLADNTYNIMIHHMFGFFCLKSLFFLLNDAFGWFGKFDGNMFYSQFWYYYLPKELNQYAVLYWIAGIGVSVLIAKATSTLWKVCKIFLKKKHNPVS